MKVSRIIEYRGFQIVKSGSRFNVLRGAEQISNAPNLDTAKGDVDRFLRGKSSFGFLVYTDEEGIAHLCEGGVYTDDAAALSAAVEYSHHTLAKGNREAASLGAKYRLVPSSRGVRLDAEVRSSLEAWMVKAIVSEC